MNKFQVIKNFYKVMAGLVNYYNGIFGEHLNKYYNKGSPSEFEDENVYIC